MNVSYEQFTTAMMAALDAVNAGQDAEPRYRMALLAGLAALDIHVKSECTCDPDLKMYCASESCLGGANVEVWVERTWRDVREGDAVRVPGNPASAATATRVGPVNHWHAAPDASQYRPNDSPMEWAGINVTLTLPDGTTNTPPYGMNPDAPVEIHTTRREVGAIELLGGWSARVVTR